MKIDKKIKKENIKHSEGKKATKEEKKKKHLSKDVIEIEKYNELEGRYKRALADYQNLQKRNIEEKNDFVKYANENLLREILPIYDNLKTSLLHINSEASQNGWAEGIKYVIKQFKEVLKNAGVEEIETKGQEFDINTMEAVEGKGEKVKKEIKAGYKLNGKLIIAAKVSLN